MCPDNQESPRDKDSGGSQRRRRRTMLKGSNLRWVRTIVMWTFFISIGLSLVSSKTLEDVGYIAAVLMLALFIFIGIFFDVIGLAVATASEKPFHSMASRRVPGARQALWLLRRADRVSSFCNDVVGDICGIISGATAAVLAARAAGSLGISLMVSQLVVAALVSALSVGGKALGKGLALRHNVFIVHWLGRVIYAWSRFRKN